MISPRLSSCPNLENPRGRKRTLRMSHKRPLGVCFLLAIRSGGKCVDLSTSRAGPASTHESSRTTNTARGREVRPSRKMYSQAARRILPSVILAQFPSLSLQNA